MPKITLPDGSNRDFDSPVTVAAISESIGPGLAKAALAGRVDGVLVDTCHVVDEDAEVAIVTERDKDGIEIIRHSCAHLMAQAVQRLFPKAQVTIGPVIEDGFFYDFAFERPFTPEDLVAIEKTMEAIVKEDLSVERSIMTRDAAVAMFKDMGEAYKVEIIEAIPGDEDLSFYKQGEFIDLCRGPHVPGTGKFKAFKLSGVAGAYWRGDSDNEMLQRVYGTAWASKKDLKLYLQRLEEAEKRDHRKLGKQLGLFHFQEEAPGMAFWHPRGWTLYQTIQGYMKQVLQRNGYQEIHTPQLVDYSLWEKSGHAAKFADEMFSVESDNRMYAIKPMNCPCHIQVFNQGLKSYRDLPLRLAEFGSCHRYEPSGSMHGLMRVRSFVQDDGHIFCTKEQIQSEVADFMELLFAVYGDFGFDEDDTGDSFLVFGGTKHSGKPASTNKTELTGAYSADGFSAGVDTSHDTNPCNYILYAKTDRFNKIHFRMNNDYTGIALNARDSDWYESLEGTDNIYTNMMAWYTAKTAATAAGYMWKALSIT
ncbi:MAG: threonine--tRNA ligase, partial [Gammaproteobacteria bacterium]|nr:threonine--tRNA ligase [Gammaproteobacteria bacterium]